PFPIQWNFPGQSLPCTRQGRESQRTPQPILSLSQLIESCRLRIMMLTYFRLLALSSALLAIAADARAASHPRYGGTLRGGGGGGRVVARSPPGRAGAGET